jgi:YQGE family putative transporter
VCYSVLFIILLTVQNKASSYIWLLGALMGTSGGFYYLSYNVLGYDFSTNDNRDFVMGIQGLVLSVATMIAPFVAAAIIEWLEGSTGYILVFSTSLTLFIIAGVLSTRIPAKTINKQYYIKSVLFLPLKKANWRYVMVGESLRGFREGVMMFLTGVLLYAIVNSELYIGYLTLISSTIQFLSFYYISGKMRPHTRKKYMLIGAVFIAAVSSIFLYKISVVTLFIYSIISSIFVTFINNSSMGIIYWVIHKTPNSQKRRIEGIVVREVYLNIGRVAGVALLLLFPNDLKTIGMIIFGLGVSQILMWHLFNKVETE